MQQSRHGLAIALMVASIGFISLVDSTCKAFTDELHAVQLVWGYFLGIFSTLCLYFLVRQVGLRELVHTNRPLLQWLRPACLVSSIMFLFVGLIYERTQTRIIADYGGLMKMVPVYGILLCIFTLSSMAVPGTNAFVGELLVLAGAFGANKAIGAVAVAGAVLSAAYMLGFYRQVALGPAIAMGGRGMWDINAREMAGILPLVVFVFWVGLYPKPFIDILHVSVEHLLAQTMGH